MGALADFGSWTESTPAAQTVPERVETCIVPRAGTKSMVTYDDLRANLYFNENTRVAHLFKSVVDLEKAAESRGIAVYVMIAGFSIFGVLVLVGLVVHFAGDRLFERSSSSSSYSPSHYSSSSSSYQSPYMPVKSSSSAFYAPQSPSPSAYGGVGQPIAMTPVGYGNQPAMSPFAIPPTWQPVTPSAPAQAQFVGMPAVDPSPAAAAPAAVDPAAPPANNNNTPLYPNVS